MGNLLSNRKGRDANLDLLVQVDETHQASRAALLLGELDQTQSEIDWRASRCCDGGLCDGGDVEGLDTQPSSSPACCGTICLRADCSKCDRDRLYFAVPYWSSASISTLCKNLFQDCSASTGGECNRGVGQERSSDCDRGKEQLSAAAS